MNITPGYKDKPNNTKKTKPKIRKSRVLIHSSLDGCFLNKAITPKIVNTNTPTTQTKKINKKISVKLVTSFEFYLT